MIARLQRLPQMAVALCTLTAAVGAAVSIAPAYASSHREAPFITRHPKVDGTDF